MSAIYFKANLLTFPLFWDPLVLAVHLLNCISSFQLKMPTYTAVIPYPRNKTLQTMLLTHWSQSHFHSWSVTLPPSSHPLSSILPMISHMYSWYNHWNPRFTLSLNTFFSRVTYLLFYLLITWLLGAFYNYLCHILEHAFASFSVCCKRYDFDKFSNNQKTFSIFCSFPLSYSYSDTICSATAHWVSLVFIKNLII